MLSDTPKQYLEVNGKTILEHTISRFAGLSQVAGILVVLSADDPCWSEVKQRHDEEYQSQCSLLFLTIGGDERSETVINGLAYLSNELKLHADQWVMVHDAARPCVRKDDILKLLTACQNNSDRDGGILATPVKDTLKLADQDCLISQTQSREAMWQAQTPQLFRLGVLQESMHRAKQAGVNITDEASAMEYSGRSVQLIEGSSDNIKLTSPSDLSIVKFLLRNIENSNGF